MSFAFGTPLEYGAIHHYGGKADMSPQNTVVPTRPWLGVQMQIPRQFIRSWLIF
ncbi:phage virion morphogenesis protein [Photobacterium sp.]|uniref:phage virion morphogenesis protein n=1 Tax=Photobacterium sp. TaxID=660 RepID=UPI0039AEC067